MTNLTQDDMAILKGHFPLSEHEFDYGNNCYIKEASICNRIEEVDPAWQLSEPKILWRDGLGGAMVCEVTLTITIKGVTRGGVGQKEVVSNKAKTAEANQAAKSAATDALKRAARLFGIGRYILSFGNSVKDERSLANWLKNNSTSQPDSASSSWLKNDSELAKVKEGLALLELDNGADAVKQARSIVDPKLSTFATPEAYLKVLEEQIESPKITIVGA